jgi:hypothetical protein
MAKTGERYAAARRAIVDGDRGATTRPVATEGGYALRGGLYPESATVANVLAHLGVTDEATGRPLDEAFILGVGGGLGAGYILWEFKASKGAVLTLGFSARWQYPSAWLAGVVDRLGLDCRIHETGGPRAAAQALDDALDTGRPAIVWVDQQAMGIWGQPAELSGVMGYPVVVFGRSGGDYLIDDRGHAPLVLPPEILAAARGRITSYKHRLIHLGPLDAPIPAARTTTAMRAGLAEQVDHLRAPSDSFSLPAWRKWARLLTDRKNAKAWPRVFADGSGLFGTLVSLVEAVDDAAGATGGHLRSLGADFIGGAAARLGEPRLADAARAWRDAGDRWEDLADAALPASVDGAADAVEAAEELHDAVMAGEPGRQTAARAAAALWSARDRYAGSFPLAAADRDALFADLAERVQGIYEAERSALQATANAIGR